MFDSALLILILFEVIRFFYFVVDRVSKMLDLYSKSQRRILTCSLFIQESVHFKYRFLLQETVHGILLSHYVKVKSR